MREKDDREDKHPYEKIRILILEDSPADAELVECELRSHGFIFDSEVVATRATYLKALRRFRPDVILSDYDLPGFCGLEALQIKKEQSPETPFILVTGAVSEERAIEILTGGATDYVLKKKLSRLLPAVSRALHESYEHRKRKEAEAQRDLLLRDLEKRVRERTEALQAEIEEHRRSEEALIHSRNTLQAFLTAAPVGVIVTEPAGKILYANPAALKICGQGIAGNIQELFRVWKPETPEGLPIPEDQLPGHAASSGRGSPEMEIRITRRDGTRATILTQARALRTPHQHPWGSIMILQDISKRKQAERERERLFAELESSNRELESFTYSVSHDLRSPLRAIDGFSRIFLNKEETLGREENREIKLIRENARKMNDLIDDLLRLSRSGRAVLFREKVDMDQIVKETWRELIAENPGRRMELKNGSLPQARADKALLRQAVANLLSNAVKFTGRRKKAVIEIGGKSDRKESTYWIRDNGAGFDMDYCDKLFGVFQRLHSESEYDGTGIGLAIVQRIIHRHGGRVWAEGAVGKGATFYFSLPSA